MCKFITINHFVDKYEVDENLIDVKKSSGALPKHIFRKVPGSKALVDESYIVRRNEFKRRVINKSHDNFYFLTKYFTSGDLARGLSAIDKNTNYDSWMTFMRVFLFSFPSESILNFKITKMMWKFYRYTRWIIRGAFILARVKPEHRDVSVLLDRY